MTTAGKVWKTMLEARGAIPDLGYLSRQLGVPEPEVATALTWLIDNGSIARGFRLDGYKYTAGKARVKKLRQAQGKLFEGVDSGT